MSETSGHHPKGRRLRFFIWLAVLCLALGMTAAALDCRYGVDYGRNQFDLRIVLVKVLIYSAALMVVFSICFLTRAQIKRVFFWLFSWRMVKRGLKALVVLLCLVAILYVEENWRGKRAWVAYRHELEAKGEHLDINCFIPRPIPDEQNFALTPVVASCYGQVLDRSGHRLNPPNTNVVNRLKMDIMRNGVVTTLSGTNLPHFGLHARWQQAELTDLKAWQFYYRLRRIRIRLIFPTRTNFL